MIGLRLTGNGARLETIIKYEHFMTFPIYKQLDKMDCGPTCLRMIAKQLPVNGAGKVKAGQKVLWAEH